MPTYDYVCDACDHQFELFHSIKDEPKRKCPKCGKNKLRRLIGPGAAIVFKGSGFYETDYRSDSYKKGAAADKSAAGGSKSETKSDAKSEVKSEAKSAPKGKEKKAKV
jgi:putative FmdB family regulatory protein